MENEAQGFVPNDYEIKVMRLIHDPDYSDPEVIAGAGLWAAVGFLKGAGFCRQTMHEGKITYALTDKGIEHLAKIDGKIDSS